MSAPTPIKVLTNATELISLLAAEGAQSPADIAARIDVPRSSVYRLVEGLTAISLVESLADSRVRLTSRWLHLADAAHDAMAEWSSAGKVLEELVDATGQTAFLTVRRDDRAVCIDWRQGRGIGLLALKPGRSLPLNAGAAGRVLLAYGPGDSALDSAPYPSLTPHTLITREELAADIARTREQGYVRSNEDVTVGISALGSPVIDEHGTLLGALSLGGVSAEIGEREAEFVTSLHRAVARLLEGSTPSGA